jgi:hypothetical protein
MTAMPFVVGVTGEGFGVMWLVPDPSQGSCSFGPRKDAIIFPMQADAQAAADRATKAFGALSIMFTVEVAD